MQYKENTNVLNHTMVVGIMVEITMGGVTMLSIVEVTIVHQGIPHICHFFTLAKFSEKKIYTKIYTVNSQFTQ